MTQQQTPVQQLEALGYTVLNGAMRFDVAMSMGVSILACDEKGAILRISKDAGTLTVTEAKQNQVPVLPAIRLGSVAGYPHRP